MFSFLLDFHYDIVLLVHIKPLHILSHEVFVTKYSPCKLPGGCRGIGDVGQDGSFQLVLCTLHFKVGHTRTQTHPIHHVIIIIIRT